MYMLDIEQFSDAKEHVIDTYFSITYRTNTLCWVKCHFNSIFVIWYWSIILIVLLRHKASTSTHPFQVTRNFLSLKQRTWLVQARVWTATFRSDIQCPTKQTIQTFVTCIPYTQNNDTAIIITPFPFNSISL